MTAPKPTNQRRLMTGVYISPIRTPDERCVYLPFSHGLVAFGSIAFAHTARCSRATGPQKTSALSSCQDRVSLVSGFYDQSTGCRCWKYLKTAKQAKAVKRCLSVCPLRIKFELTK